MAQLFVFRRSPLSLMCGAHQASQDRSCITAESSRAWEISPDLSPGVTSSPRWVISQRADGQTSITCTTVAAPQVRGDDPLAWLLTMGPATQGGVMRHWALLAPIRALDVVITAIGLAVLAIAQLQAARRIDELCTLRRTEMERDRRALYWRAYADALDDLAGGDMIGDTSLPLNGKE